MFPNLFQIFSCFLLFFGVFLLLRHSGTLSKQWIKEMYCARHERGNSDESSNTTGAAEKRAKSGKRIRVGREACGAAKNLYVKNVRCEYMI